MCDCREAVNKRLAISNARIAVGFQYRHDERDIARMDLAAPMIVLEKVDGKQRGKPPTLLSTCCPFCGERYPDTDAIKTAEETTP